MSQVPARNTVQFYRGDKSNLPAAAKEVTLYMVPGENNIYVCFKDETPEMKNEIKIENDLKIQK